jgi:hypothetical protein
LSLKLGRIVRVVIFAGLTTVASLLEGCYIADLPLPGPFEGRVIDKQSGGPIAGARVEAENGCHDNPLPDGPGHFHVRSSTLTDKNGFFRLEKETRRGGFFGCRFALKISADGYIPATLIYEPKGIPLPAETKTDPLMDTSTFEKPPAKWEVQLAAAPPVLLMAIKSGNPIYQKQARKELTGLIGIDYGYDADKWEEAMIRKKRGNAEPPTRESSLKRQDCPCPEPVHKEGPSRDIRKKISALLRASALGDLKEVQDILGSGVDCDARNVSCLTALMQAANSGHLALAEFLLSKGADVNARDKQCRTALMYAASYGNSTEVLRVLLAHGADANLTDQDGLTALMVAAMFGHKEMVGMLLSKGAKVDLKDKDGETAWFKASVIKNEEVLTLLKAYGAKE